MGRPSKLTPPQREEVLERLDRGDSLTHIARTYRVAYTTSPGCALSAASRPSWRKAQVTRYGHALDANIIEASDRDHERRRLRSKRRGALG